MERFWDVVITEPLKDFLQRLLDFLPRLLSSLLILGLGLVIAWVLSYIVLRVLEILKADRRLQRLGLSQPLEESSIKEPPSKLISQLFFWLLVIIFVNMSLYALGVPAIENLLENLFLYIPDVFISVVIIVTGYLIGNFLGRAVLIAAVNSGVRFAGLLGRGVKLSIFLLALTMALEQLGIGRDTVIIAFTIIFGGVVFALSLAFGLAGKDLAKEYLEKRLKDDEDKKDEIRHM